MSLHADVTVQIYSEVSDRSRQNNDVDANTQTGLWNPMLTSNGFSPEHFRLGCVELRTITLHPFCNVIHASRNPLLQLQDIRRRRVAADLHVVSIQMRNEVVASNSRRRSWSAKTPLAFDTVETGNSSCGELLTVQFGQVSRRGDDKIPRPSPGNRSQMESHSESWRRISFRCAVYFHPPVLHLPIYGRFLRSGAFEVCFQLGVRENWSEIRIVTAYPAKSSMPFRSGSPIALSGGSQPPPDLPPNPDGPCGGS